MAALVGDSVEIDDPSVAAIGDEPPAPPIDEVEGAWLFSVGYAGAIPSGVSPGGQLFGGEVSSVSAGLGFATVRTLDYARLLREAPDDPRVQHVEGDLRGVIRPAVP